MSEPVFSVVVPVLNEAENIEPLLSEITAALRGRYPYEVIYVNDGSTDETGSVLAKLMTTVPELRVMQHEKRSGQSFSVRTGAKAARGVWLATLDGDGQNDPADPAQDV